MKSIKKGKAEDKIYDIVSLKDYPSINEELYDDIAVEYKGCIYPKRNQGDDRPGIYSTNCIDYIVEPSEAESDKYCSDSNIIDFKSEDIKELIMKSNKLKDMEREILVNPDNVIDPVVDANDDPEMVALKRAISAKKIDLYKYAPRFGPNFQNDRRLLQDNSITMYKLKRFLDNLDLKGTIIIEDKSPDVPNPMNTVIVAELNGGE